MGKLVVGPADCEARSAIQVRTLQRRAAFIGSLVAAVGIAWLAASHNDFHLLTAFPTVVALCGAVIFLLAFVVRGNGGEWLAILGAMTLATGWVLASQRGDGSWRTWIFAWPAVFPVSVGVGMTVFGGVRKRGTHVAGLVYAAVGVAAYLFGAAAYQILVGKTNVYRIVDWKAKWTVRLDSATPIALTVVGVVLLGIGFIRLGRRAR